MNYRDKSLFEQLMCTGIEVIVVQNDTEAELCGFESYADVSCDILALNQHGESDSNVSPTVKSLCSGKDTE